MGKRFPDICPHIDIDREARLARVDTSGPDVAGSGVPGPGNR